MKQILVIDRDDGSRRVIRELLENYGGFKVVDSANGAAAFQQTQNRCQPVDLILTDTITPGKKAEKATQQLCDQFPQAPLIALTDIRQDTASAAYQHLAGNMKTNPTIVKPFHPSDFFHAIDDALQSQ